MEVKKSNQVKDAVLDLYRIAMKSPEGSLQDARNSFASIRIDRPLINNVELGSSVLPGRHILEDDYQEISLDDVIDPILE